MKKGDMVTVIMSRNDVFPFQNSPRFEATIKYYPCAAGEEYVFVVDGKEVHINPSATDFIGYVVCPEESETPTEADKRIWEMIEQAAKDYVSPDTHQETQ